MFLLQVYRLLMPAFYIVSLLNNSIFLPPYAACLFPLLTAAGRTFLIRCFADWVIILFLLTVFLFFRTFLQQFCSFLPIPFYIIAIRFVKRRFSRCVRAAVWSHSRKYLPILYLCFILKTVFSDKIPNTVFQRGSFRKTFLLMQIILIEYFAW